jgi:hypothetical protein
MSSEQVKIDESLEIASGGRTCPSCDRVFDTEAGMKTHYGHKHGRPLPWRKTTCDECGKEYTPQPRGKESKYCSAKCTALGLRSEKASFVLEDTSGYPRWNAGDKKVAVHQLLAVSEGADPHKVFGRNEWNVDHSNGCKLDNRPENLELLHVSEHGRKDGSGPARYTHQDLLSVIAFFLDPKST